MTPFLGGIVPPFGRNKEEPGGFRSLLGIGSVAEQEEVEEEGVFHENEGCKFRDHMVPIPFV